ncbi:MAG: protein-L-isoaspartate O-methyltransferase [Rickettsiales bacterium]|jgi:protein-L-isoaspartate(D-aspartate) O-methyltransferase|nr:protein-L-isoaspartate O-methyltransferase [Rickettsiales bacterium]
MNTPDTARSNMVLSQVRANDVTDKKLLSVLSSLPRHLFVPESLRSISYVDKALPLGNNRYLLPPLLFARMAEAADIQASDVVLDIGCGSGYSSVVFASLGHKVFAIEDDRDLCSGANYILHHLGVTKVIVMSNPLAAGHPDGGPYDVIFINGALQRIPDSLLSQLSERGGRLVAVLKETTHSNGIVTLCQRTGDTYTYTHLFEASAPLLPGFEDPSSFRSFRFE